VQYQSVQQAASATTSCQHPGTTYCDASVNRAARAARVRIYCIKLGFSKEQFRLCSVVAAVTTSTTTDRPIELSRTEFAVVPNGTMVDDFVPVMNYIYDIINDIEKYNMHIAPKPPKGFYYCVTQRKKRWTIAFGFRADYGARRREHSVNR
jgi:hypothetical protein